MKKTLINLAMFQLGWLVCVVGGNYYALAFTLVALIIHGYLVLEVKAEWKLIAVVVLVGCAWDFVMVQTGRLGFVDEPLLGIPIWLICLWVLFATTLMHCLSWLSRYLWLAVIFAALMGPASYWFGAKMSDAELGLPIMTSLLVMAFGWGLLFPAGLFIASKVKNAN